jgi:calcineurin-like phosphoesterase family protein
MSNLLFSSDLHFHHKKICEYSGRPYSSVQEMNEALIKNWNEVVEPNDTIWTLGDFSFGNYQEITSVLRRLNGNHNMVLGNHDQTLIANKDDLLQSGLVKSIQHYKELKYNGNFIVLFHYGQRVWNKSHHGSIMLYGHSHGSLPPFGKSVDVGVDSKEITSEYRPVSIDEVVKYMKNRQGEVVDHHGRSE